MANVIILLVILLAVVFIVRSYIKKGGHSDCCGTDGPVVAKGPADKNVANYSHTYTVQVNGMSCENCVKTVTNAFNAVPDTMAKVSLAKGTATVYTKDARSAEDLTRVVRNVGYGVGTINEVST